MKRRLIRAAARAERPAAWVLLVGAVATIVAVVVRLVTLGNATLPTVLVAADLLVTAATSLQEAYSDELEDERP